MREIKFRAWVKYFKEMYPVLQIDFTKNKVFMENNKKGIPTGFVFLSDCELMQYTGLKDSKRTKEFPEGQEIYEGDILDAGDRIVKVKFNVQMGCWDCDWIRYKGEITSNGITPVEWKYRTTVIGNIYESEVSP